MSLGDLFILETYIKGALKFKHNAIILTQYKILTNTGAHNICQWNIIYI